MKKIKINIVLVLTALVFCSVNIAAQSAVSRTSYFMDNAPYKHVLNPALSPTKGYVSMPVLGSFDLGINSTMGVKTFLYPGLNPGDPVRTFMHPTVGTAEFVNSLSKNNFFEINNRISLIGFGFYTGTMFWNFDIATRIQSNVNLPKDLFRFLKEGLPYDQDYTYNIDNLGVNAHMIVETAVGTSLNITDDIRVGAKAKLLFGGARAYIGMDQMRIYATPNNEAEKLRLTSKGGMDIYMKGLQLIEDEESGIKPDMDLNNIGIAGMGLGADLGAVWQTPLDFLTVSMGITDLGFINWGKKNHLSAKVQAEVGYTGVSDFMGSEDSDSIPIMTQLMKLTQLQIQDSKNSSLQGLNPNITIGAEAGLLNNKYTAGLLISNRLSAQHWVTEISLLANVKPIHHVNFSTNFTILNTIKGVMPSVGAALAIDFFAGNIFFACDYIPLKFSPQFIPLSPVNTHIQFGLTWSIGKVKKNFLKPNYGLLKEKPTVQDNTSSNNSIEVIELNYN